MHTEQAEVQRVSLLLLLLLLSGDGSALWLPGQLPRGLQVFLFAVSVLLEQIIEGERVSNSILENK